MKDFILGILCCIVFGPFVMCLLGFLAVMFFVFLGWLDEKRKSK